MKSLDLMVHIAHKFHAGQPYGEHSYTYHLNGVAMSVAQGHKNDERLQEIAWGHDLLEDTSCTKEILYALFDNDVVNAIVAMTKVWGESQEDYLARVKANPLAREVKKHDTLCNMQESLFRGDMKRVKKYAFQLAELA